MRTSSMSQPSMMMSRRCDRMIYSKKIGALYLPDADRRVDSRRHMQWIDARRIVVPVAFARLVPAL